MNALYIRDLTSAGNVGASYDVIGVREPNRYDTAAPYNDKQVSHQLLTVEIFALSVCAVCSFRSRVRITTYVLCAQISSRRADL